MLSPCDSPRAVCGTGAESAEDGAAVWESRRWRRGARGSPRCALFAGMWSLLSDVRGRRRRRAWDEMGGARRLAPAAHAPPLFVGINYAAKTAACINS